MIRHHTSFMIVILKSMGFLKTQKSRYLENETLSFPQITKFISWTSKATLFQKKFF